MITSRIGIDLFCGAGGMTEGATRAGVDVRLAVNHWQPAVWSHGDNHPGCEHYCSRLEDIDPFTDKKVQALAARDVFVIFGGPSCTDHSNAKGGRPRNDQLRTHPFVMLKWVDAVRPSWVVVENVPEFRNWGPLSKKGKPLKSMRGRTFKAWVAALESLNYTVDWRILNAADYGAPTKRRRLFIVARRGQRKAIPWPEPTHAPAAEAEAAGLKPWRPVAGCLDWSDLGESIFLRKRQLKDNTINRIRAGLEKFVGPYVTKLRGTSIKQLASSPESINDPLSTISAGGRHHGLVTPFLSAYHNGDDGTRRNKSVDEPLPTLDTSNRYALIAPYLYRLHGPGSRDPNYDGCHGVDSPIPTLLPFMTAANGEDPGQKTDKYLICPFIVKYYGTATVAEVQNPMDTATVKNRFGLATAKLAECMGELGVADVHFRMLQVPELLRAQGFPNDYQLLGTKNEQTKMIGNSVPPPLMQALCEAIL